MPVDEAAQVLARIDAAGLTPADIDPYRPDPELVNIPGPNYNRTYVMGQVRRMRFLEVLKAATDAETGDAIKQAREAVGWGYNHYLKIRRDDKKFKAAVDAIRGASVGRPKMHPGLKSQATKAEKAAYIEKHGGPPPLVAFTPPKATAPPVLTAKDRELWGDGFAGFRKVFFAMDTPWFHQLIVNTLEKSEPGSVTLILLPPEHGKLLADDTPVATPSGWRKLAELTVGDEVFGDDGMPTRVTAIYVDPQPELRRISFSDGATIDACVDHRWLTRTRKPQHGVSVKTTAEIETTLTAHGRPNHAIPVAEPLVTDQADLPIDPWLLGYWLGNGSRDGARMTTHADDLDWVVDRVQHAGFGSSSRVIERGNNRAGSLYVHGLAAVLRGMGVLRDKHVPSAYLWGSAAQRATLLAGLLDSDGYVGGPAGVAEFTSTTVELADAVEFLLRSLGEKPRRDVRMGKYAGKVCKASHRITWPMRTQRFTNPRKIAMHTPPNAQGDRQAWRVITNIEPIPSRPGRCITVDNASHLWLAGDALLVTSNTTVIEDWIGYKLALDPNFRIIYASEKQQHGRKVIKRVKGRMSPDGPCRAYVQRFGPFDPQTGEEAHPQPWAADFFDVYRRNESDERDYNCVALGIGSAVAGTRTDLLVVDDPQSLKSINATEKIVDEFRQDWLSRPGSKGRTVVLGTRVGERDFYEKLMELGLVDHLVCLPAIDPSNGRYLWPEHFTPEEYERMRRNVGEAAWARNYQQQPSASGERTFSQQMLADAGDSLLRVGAKPDHLEVRSCIVAHDPGFGTNAVAVAGVTEDKFVLLDWRTDHGLTSTAQMAQVLDDTMAHWSNQGIRVAHLVIEDKYVGQGLKNDDAFLDLTRKYGCSLSGHKTSLSKIDDDLGVAAMARSFRVGEVVLPDADDEHTQRMRAALDAELHAWRPMVRGIKLRQDLVMAVWFAWMRWRTERLNTTTDDRTNLIRLTGLGAVRPLSYVPAVSGKIPMAVR